MTIVKMFELLESRKDELNIKELKCQYYTMNGIKMMCSILVKKEKSFGLLEVDNFVMYINRYGDRLFTVKNEMKNVNDILDFIKNDL